MLNFNIMSDAISYLTDAARRAANNVFNARNNRRISGMKNGVNQVKTQRPSVSSTERPVLRRDRRNAARWIRATWPREERRRHTVSDVVRLAAYHGWTWP